jgi:hypothetical protein
MASHSENATFLCRSDCSHGLPHSRPGNVLHREDKLDGVGSADTTRRCPRNFEKAFQRIPNGMKKSSACCRKMSQLWSSGIKLQLTKRGLLWRCVQDLRLEQTQCVTSRGVSTWPNHISEWKSRTSGTYIVLLLSSQCVRSLENTSKESRMYALGSSMARTDLNRAGPSSCQQHLARAR